MSDAEIMNSLPDNLVEFNLLMLGIMFISTLLFFFFLNKDSEFTVGVALVFGFVAIVSIMAMGASVAESRNRENEQRLADMEFHCANIKTRDGHQWSLDSCASVLKEPFLVKAIVTDDIINHVTTTAEGEYDSTLMYGSGSYRQWQDGKGILPVKILDVEPKFPGINNGDLILLKTIDLKAMGLPVDVVVEFLCQQDAEVLKPAYDGQKLTPEYITYELDNCRMITPKFSNGE